MNIIIKILQGNKMRIDSNLVVVVTGGSSGLGEGAVKQFVSRGAKVVIADLNEEKGRELVATYPNASFFKTDVTKQQNVIALFQFVRSRHKVVHVVINCAGVLSVGSIIYPKGVASSSQMELVLKINVIGTFNMCKYAGKMMSEQQEVEGERGVIINVASVAGFEGQRGQTIYSASKGAILGMTLPMARDLGKYHIRVMTVAPGIFLTPMASGIGGKAKDSFEKAIPLGRLGNAEEFAVATRAIVQSKYATGTTWRLDGGVRLPHF